MNAKLILASLSLIIVFVLLDQQRRREMEPLQQVPPFGALIPLVPPPTVAPTRSPPILPPDGPAPHVCRPSCWCMPIVPVSFVAEEMP